MTMQQTPMPLRRGMLLIDLLMAIVVLSIILMAVVPAVRPEEPMRLIGASSVLASDIEFAQSATLANPADPTVVRFDDSGTRYWIALQSAPDTPIIRPGYSEEPYEIFLGYEADTSAEGVTLDLSELSGTTITFDPFGAVEGDTDPAVLLTNESGSMRIRVRASTGSVIIEDAT